jgi:16S rRNA (adenine1518-N6/adenine1519-N6)-dimethyltransferase
MHLSAKKSLGQHFLRSKKALEQIIDAAALAQEDTVLEIGPGEGALTEALLKTGARVVAVETDLRSIPILEERFAAFIQRKKLIIISGDIRSHALQEKLFTKPYLGNTDYKLVANIPYYITGMLFKLFLEELRQPSIIIFLIQKEVADQIMARDKKESILSLAVKAFGVPRIVGKVKREAFSPPPKVDSAIIAVEQISRERLGDLSPEAYFRVVKAGMGAKRKMLLGNLLRALDLPKATLESLFTELRISPKARGEDVPVETWIMLAKNLS